MPRAKARKAEGSGMLRRNIPIVPKISIEAINMPRDLRSWVLPALCPGAHGAVGPPGRGGIGIGPPGAQTPRGQAQQAVGPVSARKGKPPADSRENLQAGFRRKVCDRNQSRVGEFPALCGGAPSPGDVRYRFCAWRHAFRLAARGISSHDPGRIRLLANFPQACGRKIPDRVGDDRGGLHAHR